uniref:uncharacterized protein LOC122591037 n=1 Tax=Erigeron canadensis TaxID=72917 RepID=UPI001CB9A233|nr:uncharacterized protein LOC122591037 [Erigeron canadensis]
MRELCCSVVSAVVIRSLFVFLVFEFGVVGATLGLIAGAVIGWRNNKIRLIEGVIMGALSGAAFSYKLITTTFDYFLSDDAKEIDFFVHLVKLITGDLVKLILNDEHKIMRFNKQAQFSKAAAYSLEDFNSSDPACC